MAEFDETLFSLERIQYDWLPTIRQRVAISVHFLDFIFLVRVLFVGLVLGLFVGPVFGLFVGPVFGLFVGLVGGLFVGLGVGMVEAVGRATTLDEERFYGLNYLHIHPGAVPNEGVRQGCLGALIFGLVFGLVYGLGFGLGFGLVIGLAIGLVVGLLAGMAGGGEECVRYVVLRVLLIGSGSTPWNYVKFLDHATDRLLLRKVGGGYVFLHRMLLDYFAARYVERLVGGANPPSHSRSKTNRRP